MTLTMIQRDLSKNVKFHQGWNAEVSNADWHKRKLVSRLTIFYLTTIRLDCHHYCLLFDHH